MRRTWLILLASIGATAIAIGASAAQAAPDDLHLASRSSDPAVDPGDDDTQLAAISGTGRYVAFTSDADNLDLGDDDLRTVFVRDLVAGTTTNVFRQDGGTAHATGGADTDVAISADGSCVAFRSTADDLTPDPDDDDQQHIYVRRIATSETILVSRASGAGGAPGNNGSSEPSISADCRYVAFFSAADNLAASDNPGVGDAFVRDLAASTTTWVSQTTLGDPVNANANNPEISADGRYVVFDVDDDLTTDDTNGTFDVYVRDLVGGTTEVVSRATGGGPALSGNDPSISADGRFVAFASNNSAYIPGQDLDVRPDVFVRDRLTGVTTHVSRADGANGIDAEGDADRPSISADGSRVAFQSDAFNLTPGDEDGNGDVHVRDLLAGTTVQASRAAGPFGTPGLGTSEDPRISGDGRFVAFISNDELGYGTFGQQAFVRELGSPAQPPPPPTGDPAPPSQPSQPPIQPEAPVQPQPPVAKPAATCKSPKGSAAPCRITLTLIVKRSAKVLVDVQKLRRKKKPLTLGTVEYRVKPPSARIVLPKKIKRKLLKPGRYRLVVRVGKARFGRLNVTVR